MFRVRDKDRLAAVDHRPRLGAVCAVVTALALVPAKADQLVPSDIVGGFDELEIESIDVNITIALETVPDLGSWDWFSSSNAARGTIRVLRSFEFDARACRELQIVMKQAGFTDQRSVNFCRGDDYYWHPLTYTLKGEQ